MRRQILSITKAARSRDSSSSCGPTGTSALKIYSVLASSSGLKSYLDSYIQMGFRIVSLRSYKLASNSRILGMSKINAVLTVRWGHLWCHSYQTPNSRPGRGHNNIQNSVKYSQLHQIKFWQWEMFTEYLKISPNFWFFRGDKHFKCLTVITLAL